MTQKVICIKECKGKDASAKFSVGDLLHQSEVPIEVKFILIFECGVDPADCCIIEEEPFINGQYAIWPKANFAPLSDIDEEESEAMKNIQWNILTK